MATNQTLQDFLELEKEVRYLSKKSAVKITIRTNNMSELKDAAKSLGVHLYQPFETGDINVHHMIYYMPGTESSITIRHTEEYRMKKELVPVS